ncbi:MAG TPA: ATP-binding cassette domain-containing protein [Polyangiaceae bacterium]|nr:ATP-binding cassette domain-containing protein [Polyangiaceae bacterium]
MIHLDAVTKTFERSVLRGVTLHVPEGCVYGLIGAGGAGKSVVVKAIAGLVVPDGGEIVVGGKEVLSMTEAELAEHRKNIGMLFQNNALFDFMSIGDNVAFPLRRLKRAPESEVAERVAERLARVGLPGFEARMPSSLSGGQKKRVGLARATITRAPIVLCDEPAAGLDPVTSQRIFDLLREEQQRARSTVFVVSSDVDRLLTVTDRIGVLHEGEIVFEGTTDETRASDVPLVRQLLRGDNDGPI